jgi:hypothetical protein
MAAQAIWSLIANNKSPDENTAVFSSGLLKVARGCERGMEKGVL